MMLVACLAYMTVAVIVAANTFIEGEEKQSHWGIARIAGLSLSLAWPAIILLAIGCVYLERSIPLRNHFQLYATKALRK